MTGIVLLVLYIEKFLVMSIFLLAFAIGPFVWGPMSEVFGRVRVMQCET